MFLDILRHLSPSCSRQSPVCKGIGMRDRLKKTARRLLTALEFGNEEMRWDMVIPNTS